MKFRYARFIFALIALFAAGLAEARQIDFEITVRERAADSQYILIAKQPLSIRENTTVTSFITNFTLDLTASYNDSGYYQCEFSLFTIGPNSQTIFKKFQSFPGGVYFVDNVRVKNGVVYRVGISPLNIDSSAAVDTVCDFDYRKDGIWRFDPSAHFDFYFVGQTLGDARWNALRDFLEINYKTFKKSFDPTFPGKINCFFAPCVLPEVTWDKRSGYAIDPPRFNCFMLYSQQYNTIDPVPGYLVRIYRFKGYAPPLLAEGLAAYFDFPHYYAIELKKKSALPPLAMALRSEDYFNLPGHDNITVASSFVKFLIDTYGVNRFDQAYARATDLTIADALEAVYKKPMDSLEADWYTLLDTVTFNINTFRYFYERDEYIYRRSGMDEFLNAFKKRMISRSDTIFAESKEGWTRYMDGEYDTAQTIYESLITLDSANSNSMMILGNLLLIEGRYDSARTIYRSLFAKDSTIKTVYYKTGESWYQEGNLDSAIAYFKKDISEDPSQLSQASSGIMMGRIMLAANDTSLARDYFAGAVDAMEKIYQLGKSRPAYLLRLGQAHLGLAMCDNLPLATARSFLEQARYFEVHPTRVIFMTRILHELGNLEDLEGNRSAAISLYQKAMTYPLPPHVEDEIRRQIDEPFKGYSN